MNLDLNNLLRDWPHEPGQIRVRKIVGNDGREKLQLRIDLGLIQMESAGRPDGQRPHDCESLFCYYKTKAAAAERDGQSFTLDAEQCGELQQEGVQYYHRYISLFQLNDYPGVIRDTQRNLDLFGFVAKYAEREELAWSFEQFRPYVLMMQTRARASIDLDNDDFLTAVKRIEEGRDRILEFYQESNNPELAAKSAEIGFLEEWLEEVREKRPLTKLETLRREMERAIQNEAYERAAELRDAIKAFAPRPEAE